MTNNYEDLIGKIIDWSSSNWENNKVFKVVVANIDPDLGISLVNPDDPKDTFTCLHGPSSPEYLNQRVTNESDLPWKEIFEIMVETIRAGHYKVDEYDEAIGLRGGGGKCNNPTCVFTM